MTLQTAFKDYDIECREIETKEWGNFRVVNGSCYKPHNAVKFWSSSPKTPQYMFRPAK